MVLSAFLGGVSGGGWKKRLLDVSKIHVFTDGPLMISVTLIAINLTYFALFSVPSFFYWLPTFFLLDAIQISMLEV